MCYEPFYVKRLVKYNDETGQYENKLFMTKKYNIMHDDYDFTLPCGHCAECLIEHSNEWAFRICLESKAYEKNCFLTLTYAETNGSLNKKDLQNFLKRFRKKLGPHRYFACGEYGSKGKRPHYHLIIFNYFPDDAVLFNKEKKMYGSEEISSLWGKGFVSCSDLSLYDARYCAKYMQKLNDIPPEYVQPFVCMSLKPGLGAKYFDEHMDELLKSDKIYFNGQYIKTPRYFLIRALRVGRIDEFMEIKENRSKKSALLNFTFQDLEARKNKYKNILGKA